MNPNAMAESTAIIVVQVQAVNSSEGFMTRMIILPQHTWSEDYVLSGNAISPETRYRVQVAKLLFLVNSI